MRWAWQQRVRVCLPDRDPQDFLARPFLAPRPLPAMSPPRPVEWELTGAAQPGTQVFLVQMLDVYEEDPAGWLVDHLVDLTDLHLNPRDYQIRWSVVERREVELRVLFVLYPALASTESLDSMVVPLPVAALQAARLTCYTGTLRLDLDGSSSLMGDFQQGRVTTLRVVEEAFSPHGPRIQGLSEGDLAAGVAKLAMDASLDALLPVASAQHFAAARQAWIRGAALSFARACLALSCFFLLLSVGFSANTRHLHRQTRSLHQLRDSLQTLLDEQAAYASQVVELIGPALERTDWSARLRELAACSSDSVIWTDVLATTEDGRCLLHGLALDQDAALRVSACLSKSKVLADPALSPVRLAKKGELPEGMIPDRQLLYFEISGALHE